MDAPGHRTVWRGYDYGSRGEFTKEWRFESSDVAVDTQGLENYMNVSAWVEDVIAGQRLTLNPWQYVRGVEPSLRDIVDPSGMVRWSTDGAASAYRNSELVLNEDTSHPLAYDGNGRLTLGPGWSAEFNAFDQLVRATGEGGTETYLYDGLGRLVGTNSDAGFRMLAYDGEWVTAELGPDGTPVWWGIRVPTDGSLAYARTPERAVVPFEDHRRNIVALADASDGATIQQYDYSPYGRAQVYSGDGAPVCREEETDTGNCARLLPLGYGLSWRSSVTGLMNMGARWYDPRLGQFLSVDPLLYVDGYDPYAYSGYDPINRWDPFGLKSNSIGGPVLAGGLAQPSGYRPPAPVPAPRPWTPVSIPGGLGGPKVSGPRGGLAGLPSLLFAVFEIGKQIGGSDLLDETLARIDDLFASKPAEKPQKKSAPPAPEPGLELFSIDPDSRYGQWRGSRTGEFYDGGQCTPEGYSPGAGGVSNPVPDRLARVIPGDVNPTMLGRPGSVDVFVTAADDIAGMSPAQIAERLTIPESTTYTIIEFPSPAEGLASPVLRANPGFVGGGRTAGGAREFVIPNGPIPEGAVIRRVGQ